jgi:hypothetical protein
LDRLLKNEFSGPLSMQERGYPCFKIWWQKKTMSWTEMPHFWRRFQVVLGDEAVNVLRSKNNLV